MRKLLINEEGRAKIFPEPVSVIRLKEAYFCLSCEVVTNCADICPACGHRQLWHLENWLGRVHGQNNDRHEESALTKMEN